MTQIIAVDDGLAMRQMLRAMLEPEGYTMLEAEDGAKGLVALRATDHPSIVLLDYYMPHMDGGAVLRTVADEGGLLARHEYIVISSSVGTFPEDFIDLLRQLSIRILPKPFGRESLVSAVAQAAERLNAPLDEPFLFSADDESAQS
ncbi:MAG TPA: response regulator [Ktedonobacterales bacterium]|nr:response regulator [Ktedonobacterales bacterium]